ncbi:unnamed protein product [Orchesella dallaii]|uniref:Uncharacterized protein n=1 Tax=Orchesella dallaii TaxID=48710 RepID=A0ABP1RMA8_9HEXA
MIDSETAKQLERLFKTASYFGSIPYTWDPQKKKLVSTSSCWRRYCIANTLNIIYMIYLIAALIHELFKPQPDLSTLTLPFGTLTMVICSLILSLNLSRRGSEVSDFVNAYFEYFEAISDQYARKGKKMHLRGCKIMAQLTFAAIPIVTFVYVVNVLSNPGDKVYVTSMLTGSNAQYRYIPAVLPYCIYEGVVIMSVISFYFMVFTIPVLCMHALGNEIM